jgi:hypothetical protein
MEGYGGGLISLLPRHFLKQLQSDFLCVDFVIKHNLYKILKFNLREQSG